MSTFYTHTHKLVLLFLFCLRILCAQLENTCGNEGARSPVSFSETISLRLLAAVLSSVFSGVEMGTGALKFADCRRLRPPRPTREEGGGRKTHSLLSRAEKEKKTSTPLVNFKRRRTLLVQSAANPFIFLRQRKRKCPLCFKSPFAKIPRIHCKKKLDRMKMDFRRPSPKAATASLI